jgi:hypothetical protein
MRSRETRRGRLCSRTPPLPDLIVHLSASHACTSSFKPLRHINMALSPSAPAPRIAAGPVISGGQERSSLVCFPGRRALRHQPCKYSSRRETTVSRVRLGCVGGWHRNSRRQSQAIHGAHGSVDASASGRHTPSARAGDDLP